MAHSCHDTHNVLILSYSPDRCLLSRMLQIGLLVQLLRMSLHTAVALVCKPVSTRLHTNRRLHEPTSILSEVHVFHDSF
jgi:hypothetical protein